MEIRHLRLVKAIAKNKSLTASAKELKLTQPALSHQLKELEQSLKIQLFKRVNKRMIITDAGEKILQSSKKILNELDKVKNEIGLLSNEQKGIIRISTECYTTYHWLPSIIKSYNKEYPDIEVEIVVEATRTPLEYLLNGKLDIALVNSKKTIPNLLFNHVTDDEIVLITSTNHDLAKKEFVTAKDFEKETLITYNSSEEELFIFNSLLIPKSVKPNKVMKVAFTEAIFGMVKGGIGIAAVNKWAAIPYINSGELCGIRITKKGLKRKWFAASVRANTSKKYLKHFIEHLKISH